MFKYVVLFTAVFIAICAATFSVTGIAQLFTGAVLLTGIMATSLELGKIISVSLLYRYWSDIPRLIRYYLVAGLVILTGITSVGIYGYLSSAYATGAADIQTKQNTILMHETQRTGIEESMARLSSRSQQLQTTRGQQENRLDSLLANGRSITTQQRIIREQDAELINIQKQLSTLSATRDSLALATLTVRNSISTAGKIGSFYYVAESFGIPLDTVVKWFILIIVLVFDPVSICLFFGYNIIRNKELASDLAPVLSPKAISHESIIEPESSSSQPLDDMPYYMRSDFNWKTDDRWKTDEDARHYLARLGMSPLDN
jgi:hypothetical protein